MAPNTRSQQQFLNYRSFSESDETCRISSKCTQHIYMNTKFHLKFKECLTFNFCLKTSNLGEITNLLQDCIEESLDFHSGL